jgi:hypothetical protein
MTSATTVAGTSLGRYALLASVAAAVALAYVRLATPEAERGTESLGLGLARAALVLLLVVGLGSVAVDLGGHVLGVTAAGATGEADDAGARAVLGTTVLSVLAIGLAFAKHRNGARELGWLAFGLLGVVALKLAAVDLPNGRASTLVGAFTVYGAALIIAPRLARHATASTAS